MDLVNQPKHYTSHPSGIEAIQITEHMNFCLGNAMKYIWRAGLKADALEDLKKASWYINREIERLTNEDNSIRSRDERAARGSDEDSLHSVESSGGRKNSPYRRTQMDWELLGATEYSR